MRLHHIQRLGAATIFVALTTASAGCARSGVDWFVRPTAPTLALTHVRVIDGTGDPGTDDQTIVVEGGRIRAVGHFGAVQVPPGAGTLDLRGRTVIPGLVGMHEHLFYQIQQPSSDAFVVTAQAAFARLYLASGVTTIRTAGAVDFAGDRRIKQLVDQGKEPGPKIHLTGSYLNRSPGAPDPAAMAREVAAQADAGATSFKAYTTLRSAELQAAIKAAHERGLTITGHLCAVGFEEAAAMGIDNLEHGLAVDTEFYSGKRSDECPDSGAVIDELTTMDITDSAIQQLIAQLVRHGVAVTSTLAVLETFTGRDSAFDPRLPEVLASRLEERYRTAREPWTDRTSPQAVMWALMLRKEMQFERRFAAAGGRLMAGVDPTGWGGVVAGFGDQRELELLVEAGFSPEEAIRIATRNGASFLDESQTIGTVEAGKQADLVVVRGNPSTNISDVRNVELVFKDGVAYDPARLVAASKGTVGEIDPWRVLRLWPVQVLLGILLLLLAARILSTTSSASHRAWL